MQNTIFTVTRRDHSIVLILIEGRKYANIVIVFVFVFKYFFSNLLI